MSDLDFDLPDSLNGVLGEMAMEQATKSLAYMTAYFYNELIHHEIPQIEASRMARAFLKAILAGSLPNGSQSGEN